MAGPEDDPPPGADLLLPGAGAPPPSEELSRLPGGDAEPVAGPRVPDERSFVDQHVASLTGGPQPGTVPVARPGSWQDLLTAPLGSPATMGGGGHYTVDPGRAPQAIADLRHAAELLEAELYNAYDLANYPSPGLDAVSVDAVRVISEAAIGEQGSLRVALQGAMDEFHRQADKLEADLTTYLQVEQLNIPAPSPMEPL